MASKRFEIDMGLNASDVARGATDAEKSLKKLEDAVEDTGKGGARDLDSLENELKDVQRQAEKSERAVDDIGTGAKRGFNKAGDAVTEFKGEALQNLSEVASSFDGSVESIGELAQGTLGGVASSIPIVGLAAAGAAAAVGTITDALTKAKEATDEARESAYTYGITVAEAGEYANAAGRINELTGSVEGLRKVMDIATVSGWDQKDVVTALATGDGLPALAKAFDDGANSTLVSIGRVNELQGALDGTAQGFGLAKDAASLNAQALFELAQSAGEATGEVDDLGNAIVKMPDGKEVVVNAQTGEAYENLDAIEQKRLSDKSFTVRLNVDSTSLDNALGRAQAKAARGIDVIVRANQVVWH